MTEAQSYSLEARRAEELAHRLETQSSWFAGNSAAGSLNLSQAYRDWGLSEMDANRDYYGSARFDDVAFQLSPQGQELQARFVSGYADRLHDQIDDKLTLPEFTPVQRPTINGSSDVHGPTAGSAGGTDTDHRELAIDVEAIGEEVRGKQSRGSRRIDRVGDGLKDKTRSARGASAESADEIKEW